MGIFYFRLYYVNIYMSKKYQIKYQKTHRKPSFRSPRGKIEAGKRLKKPQAYISKIERGEREVDAVELDELAKIYGKPLDYFVK